MVEATQTRQFTLKWVFVVVSAVAIIAAVAGFLVRPKPNRIPEAILLQSVDTVKAGMSLQNVCECMGTEPSAKWLNDTLDGFVVWRFEVSDVAYDDSRASYFVKFNAGAVEESFLLYPLEAAGGGMVF